MFTIPSYATPLYPAAEFGASGSSGTSSPGGTSTPGAYGGLFPGGLYGKSLFSSPLYPSQTSAGKSGPVLKPKWYPGLMHRRARSG